MAILPEKVYLVVPCYNEEAVLPGTVERLAGKVRELVEKGLAAEGSRVLLVDDGSRDRTWELIRGSHGSDPAVTGIRLAHNRGHQNALLAGLMAAKERCGVTVSLDADLQDDVDAIDGMLELFYQGCDIVYGVRSDRNSDTAFKRTTALAFYRLMAWLGVETVQNHADCRLMSRRALDALGQFREVNLFLRGLVPMIGFRSAEVTYERRPRMAGESKYSVGKMLNLALDGVTSLSVRPIRFVAVTGGVLLLGGLAWLAALLGMLLAGRGVSGITALLASVWTAAGLQLTGIGIIGEYLGKVYLEVKDRPRYIIETDLEEDC